jgi:hypothetical protein
MRLEDTSRYTTTNNYGVRGKYMTNITLCMQPLMPTEAREALAVVERAG